MMATAMLHTSMLPSIKCSGCGSEVQLSMMGDHQCSNSSEVTQESSWNVQSLQNEQAQHQDRIQAPTETSQELSNASDSPRQTLSNHSKTRSHSLVRSRSASQQSMACSISASQRLSRSRSGSFTDHFRKGSKDSARASKQKPPSLDMAAALGLSRPIAPPTASESVMLNRSTSPTLSPDTSASGSLIPPRSAPEPPVRPRSPSVPEMARVQDPAYSTNLSHAPLPRPEQRSDAATSSPTLENPPILHPNIQPPKAKAGLNSFLKRMNTLTPKEGQTSQDRPMGLFRRKSSKQLSKKEITLVQGSFRRGSDSATPPMPATAAVVQTGDLYPLAKRDGDGRPLPAGPAPPRPPPPERVEGLMEHLHTNVATVMVHPASPESVTPLSNTESSEFDFRVAQPVGERDSISSVYSIQKSPSSDRIHPSYSALKRISEVDDAPSDFAETSSATWPSTPNLNSNAPSPDPSHDRVPPLPGFGENGSKSAHHTPSESVSSNGSKSGFGDRAWSLRSSPPTSNGSTLSLRKQGLDELGPEGQDARNKAANFSRPRIAEAPISSQFAYSPSNSAPSPQSPTLPESPMDPAMHSGALSMSAKSTEILGPPSGPKERMEEFSRNPLQKSHTAPLPSAVRPSVGKRSVTAYKGDCRGCGKSIIGKSIKAADGRLTGRYHKECFVCKTCSLPFQTADFYVFGNFPYCAYHYHVLNQSLCHACNHGIEGQYLESQPRRRYHLQCFTCHDCRKPLTHDYFEINHFFYCEFDARRAYQRTTVHGPTRRFPERRTTKLMMM